MGCKREGEMSTLAALHSDRFLGEIIYLTRKNIRQDFIVFIRN